MTQPFFKKFVRTFFLSFLCIFTTINTHTVTSNNAIQTALDMNFAATTGIFMTSGFENLYYQEREFGMAILHSTGDYIAYLKAELRNLQKFPNSFVDQVCVAAILSVYSEHMQEPLRAQMQQKSQELFAKLYTEIQENRIENPTGFNKNLQGFFDYSYLLAMEKYQELYVWAEEINTNQDSSDFLTKMAQYAQAIALTYLTKQSWQQFKANNNHLEHQQAIECAKQAIPIWENYIQKDPAYFRSYADYAFVLGVLGRYEDMEQAFHVGAKLINTDLNHPDFALVQSLLFSFEISE